MLSRRGLKFSLLLSFSVLTTHSSLLGPQLELHTMSWPALTVFSMRGQRGHLKTIPGQTVICIQAWSCSLECPPRVRKTERRRRSLWFMLLWSRTGACLPCSWLCGISCQAPCTGAMLSLDSPVTLGPHMLSVRVLRVHEIHMFTFGFISTLGLRPGLHRFSGFYSKQITLVTQSCHQTPCTRF